MKKPGSTSFDSLSLPQLTAIVGDSNAKIKVAKGWLAAMRELYPENFGGEVAAKEDDDDETPTTASGTPAPRSSLEVDES